MNYDNTEFDQNEINRINRHKRRVRNRIIAISVFIFVLLLVIGAIAFGIYKIASDVNTKASIAASISASETEASLSAEEDINSIIDSLLSEEEEVVDPEEEVSENKTPEELLDLEITNIISRMTISEKVAGLFIITPEQLSDVDLAVKAGDGTKNALLEYPVGGLVYKDENILSNEQFAEMLKNTSEFSKFKLFTCLNEGFEKDTVLAKKLSLDETKSTDDIIDSMDPYNAFVEAGIIGKNLDTFGINTTFGLHNLTIDYAVKEDGSLDAGEAKGLFGNDPVVAGQMAAQAVAGLKDSGKVALLATFPNDGTSEEGSDKKVSTLNKEQFAENGLNIFTASIEAGAAGLVVGNVYLPNMTGDELPASLSKELMTDYIRVELGLTDVILVTDRLDSPQIADYYSSEEAVVMALKAGADMVQCPEKFKDAYVAVLDAITKGEISEERIDQSLKRIMKYKYAQVEVSNEAGEDSDEQPAQE